MPTERTTDASRPPHLRSRVTNRSKLAMNVDGRSAAARRFRDLIDEFTEELGGDLSKAEHSLVKLAAVTFLRAEQLQAAVVNGDTVDDAELIRAVNAGARIFRDLAAAKLKRSKSAPSALETWLANREAEDEADQDDEAAA